MCRTSPAAAPESATIDQSHPTIIQVVFDGKLRTETDIDRSGLAVTVNGTFVTVNSASSDDMTLTITLAAAVPECTPAKVFYYANDGSWQDGLERDIEAFEEDIDNLVNSTWGLTCIQSDLGRIDLAFVEERVPDEDGWGLTVNGEGRGIEVEPGDNTKVVTLVPTPPVCLGDAIDVRHTRSGGSHNRTISSAAPCAISAVADRTAPDGHVRPAFGQHPTDCRQLHPDG